ncbi:Hypothetical predicted protein [Octopus vulgaris]|uniref:Uncharacterized protein n=1 Tax=Octopus vulgaris TaxID=6645 RepID=A0AA36BKW7_OCTVU|nr:Hypothetical predicted protein [Octopus vulgaris]
MSCYTNVKVNISESQKQKLQNALQTGGLVSIRLDYEDFNGEGIFALAKSQVNKMAKAYESEKCVTVKMSKSQLVRNTKVEEGFLGALASLASRLLPTIAKTVLPALGIGAWENKKSDILNCLTGFIYESGVIEIIKQTE